LCHTVPNKAKDISPGSFRYRGKRLENLHDPVKVKHVKINLAMAHHPAMRITLRRFSSVRNDLLMA
jgi:hypothetical protein